MSIVYAHLLKREDVYNAELVRSTPGSQSVVNDTHVSDTHNTLPARGPYDNCWLDRNL